MKYNHFEYTEMLARQLIPISHTDTDRHYFRASEESELKELNEMMSQAHGMIMIAIDGKNSEFGFNLADNLIEKSGFSLVIAKQTTSSDTDTIFQAQKDSYNVMMNIVARYMRDYQHSNYGCDFLDPESFAFEGFGPIGDLFYGVILDFYLETGVNYKINPEMWK